MIPETWHLIIVYIFSTELSTRTEKLGKKKKKENQLLRDWVEKQCLAYGKLGKYLLSELSTCSKMLWNQKQTAQEFRMSV